MSADKGEIAFHLVMALVSDFALYDEERLARMQNTIGNILGMLPKGGSDFAAAQAAYDSLLRIPGKAP